MLGNTRPEILGVYFTSSYKIFFFFLLFYFTTAKAVNYGAQVQQDYAHAYSRADWPDLKKQLIN